MIESPIRRLEAEKISGGVYGKIVAVLPGDEEKTEA